MDAITSVGSPMDTEESEPSMSQENGLLQFDDDVITKPSTRAIRQAWALWTEDNKKDIMDHVKYHCDCVEYYNKRWASGPTMKALPKKPKSNAAVLVRKDRKHKDASSDFGNTSNGKKKSWNLMNDVEFNEFLKGRINDNTDDTIPATSSPNNLKSAAENINSLTKEAKESDSVSLAKHLKLGKALIETKHMFDIERIKNKDNQIRKNKIKNTIKNKVEETNSSKNKTKKMKPETWKDWVEKNTIISASYARQHKEVAALITEYPKLARLDVTYTELFKMKNKIEVILEKCTSFCEFWKEK
jgi:hypothetical protein